MVVNGPVIIVQTPCDHGCTQSWTGCEHMKFVAKYQCRRDLSAYDKYDDIEHLLSALSQKELSEIRDLHPGMMITWHPPVISRETHQAIQEIYKGASI